MLQAILDSSFDCIKILDLDGTLIAINRPGCRLLEIDEPEKVIGHSWLSLWHGGDYDTAADAVARAARGEAVRFEAFGPTAKGSQRWWETCVSPVIGQGGRPERLIAITRDVTERVLRERESREAARNQSRAKDEFLATLAHELRNPLAAVVHAMAALDRIGAPSDEARHARAVIRRQTDHLATLLDDLVDIARIGEGKLELVTAPLDLRQVVERAVEAELPRARAKSQSIEVEAPADAVVVNADFARMRQVVANLLANASKYTPHGGHIRVSLRGDGTEAVLEVADDGVGIPAHMIEKVFEIFVQVDDRRARSEGGLGIGLALVKRLLQLQGGDIACSSEGDGRGTRMTVRMHLAPGARPVETARSERESDRRLNILVVEDGHDVREMLLMTLSLLGHTPVGAASARDALALAQSDVHDAIVIDIGLPDMDGRALGQKLREIVGPGVALLAFSGYGQEEDRRRSREAGFDAHLVKPLAPPQLLRAIDEAIAARTERARRGAPTAAPS